MKSTLLAAVLALSCGGRGVSVDTVPLRAGFQGSACAWRTDIDGFYNYSFEFAVAVKDVHQRYRVGAYCSDSFDNLQTQNGVVWDISPEGELDVTGMMFAEPHSWEYDFHAFRFFLWTTVDDGATWDLTDQMEVRLETSAGTHQTDPYTGCTWLVRKP